MINNKKQAKKFIQKMFEHKKALKNEHKYSRDFISENKMDAAVWRDLDAYQRAEMLGKSSVRIYQAQQRKEAQDAEHR